MLAARLRAGVVNAGDGRHGHPTQGLLDLFTIRHYKRDFRELTVASIMFMIPIPPTSSEIEAIATMTALNRRSVRLCSARSSAGTIMLKSPAP